MSKLGGEIIKEAVMKQIIVVNSKEGSVKVKNAAKLPVPSWISTLEGIRKQLYKASMADGIDDTAGNLYDAHTKLQSAILSLGYYKQP